MPRSLDAASTGGSVRALTAVGAVEAVAGRTGERRIDETECTLAGNSR